MSNGYIGIPYLDRGRDFTGCDCWGLVDLYHRTKLLKTLPSYLDSYRSAEEAAVVEAAIIYHKQFWQKLEPGEYAGGVALFNIAGRARHVGMVLEDGRSFYHTLVGRNSTLEFLDDISWVNRLVGVWRWMGR